MYDGTLTDTLVSDTSMPTAVDADAHIHDTVESAPVTLVAHIRTRLIRICEKADVASGTAPVVLTIEYMAQKSDWTRAIVAALLLRNLNVRLRTTFGLNAGGFIDIIPAGAYPGAII